MTRLFAALQAGDEGARAQLVDRVYGELKRLAAALPRGPADSMSTTEVVHCACLRLGLVGKGTPRFSNSRVFWGAAAEAMRRVLIDRARGRKAAKRGGSRTREPLAVVADRLIDGFETSLRTDFIDLHDCLEKFKAAGEKHARPHEVVNLRWFSGRSEEEVAECLGVSRATVQADWRFARDWLYRCLGGPR
jgi:RNA polymerase sigma factor (TIGR02999 family)